MRFARPTPVQIILLTAITFSMCASDGPASEGDGLIYRSQGRSRRVSSHDLNWKDGNHDWREIAPGQTLTLADIAGPGVIRHLWFTVNARDPQYPRSCVLRIYWDDAELPSVESPLGDFFASGHGLRREVDSQMVAVTSEGRAYNCYWAMPFKRRALITVTNDSPKHAVPKFYYYVDYDALDSLPAEALYFHARYRQEWPARPGDYLICEAQGPGHYVGTVLSVQLQAPGWFGEGDDRFYIDGESEPGLHGTGTEDYFCDAWGFREFMRPYYGVVLMEGFELGDRLTVYRWHVRDPIRFQKSLRFTIEHKGTAYNDRGQPISGHGERPDFFSSVAFWYQAQPGGGFASVPPLAERLVSATTIELENLQASARSDHPDTRFSVQQDQVLSGGRQLLIEPAQPGAVITLPLVIEHELSGVARLVLTPSITSGVYRARLDDQIIPTLQHQDLYGGYFRPTDFNLGYVKLTPGKHELRFECLGKQAAARAHQLGADALRIEHVTPHTTRPAGD